MKPSSSVAAVTGKPQITPPPTDSVGGSNGSGNSTGWLLAVVGLAALVVSLVIRTPARRTSR